MSQCEAEEAIGFRVVGADGYRGPVPVQGLVQLGHLVEVKPALQGITQRIRSH